jgi:hypothetical protein
MVNMAQLTETATPVERKTAFQQWETDPEPQIDANATVAPAEAEEPAEELEKPATESATEAKKTKEIDPDEQFENLPRWARKEIRKLRETKRTLEQELATREPATAKIPESAAPPKAEAKSTGEPVPPKNVDFDTLDAFDAAQAKYLRDLVRWEAQQAREAETAAATAKQREAAEKKQREAWEKQVDEIEYDDFEEVALNTSLPISEVMLVTMQELDNGAKILYYLGKNPSLADEIFKKSPAQQAAAIGKLDAKLFPEESSKTEVTAPVSRAAKPPRPLSGGTAADDLGKEPDPKDFKKWDAWKTRQERALREASGY